MERVYARFEGFIKQNNLRFLALSLGLVYIWFGALKFFPGLSPAEQLAVDTINTMTMGLIPVQVSLALLAIWEVGVGILFLTGKFRRITIGLMLVDMVCTFTPLLFFPEISFNEPPIGFSLVGQYIFKNIVLIAAALTLLANEKKF
jgi:uncharacterized membrane protein YphA (DoxX/SURF4 family)